jgi:hypothetical protein
LVPIRPLAECLILSSRRSRALVRALAHGCYRLMEIFGPGLRRVARGTCCWGEGAGETCASRAISDLVTQGPNLGPPSDVRTAKTQVDWALV